LLRDRKQNPTEKWRNELPYKAKKLEEQLYKTAPSLKEYLDKDTLKERLKQVARAITSQYRFAKGKSSLPSSKRISKRGSDSSFGSVISIPSRRNSLSNTSGDGNAIFNMSGDLAAIERQNQVNAKMQEEMLERIRNQEMLLNLMKSMNQQGGNQAQITSEQMIAASRVSQGNPLASAMGISHQMAGQLGGINGAFGVMHNPMGGMNNVMGMNVTSMNAPSFNGNGGINAGGMNVGSMGIVGSGMNMGSMNTGVLNIGGVSNIGEFNPLGLNAGGPSLGVMNGNANPLVLQQLLQQQYMAGSQQSPAPGQMSMNFRNPLNGQTNPAAMDATALMSSSMGSYTGASLPASISSGIPALPLAVSSGVNPSMPPPSVNASSRSSFTSDSGMNSSFPQDGGTDLSLSPTSFKW
jgi:hypothetical protein